VQSDSVIFGESFIPFGNDSFYHARRIIDAAFSTDGLYQFDPLMHVPEGSWVSWPWGYDYFLAKLLQIVSWMSPATDPMRVLVYVPVFWTTVNVALLLALTTALGLQPEFRVMVVIGFSLMPLTQSLHGIGQIDHHFMELTFVLLCAWMLLRTLAHGAGRKAAIFCGASLGLAQAFHHGLFVLQIPVLATIFVLWWHNSIPPKVDLHALAISLLVSTILISLPSGPLIDGQFSFSTLSWFHPYVALCSSVLLAIMAIRPFERRIFLILLGTGVVLALPVISGIMLGANFLTGNSPALENINEMNSPLAMIRGGWGLTGTVSIYSWLVLLTPCLLLIGIWQGFRSRQPQEIAYAIFSVFGLGLLLMQYRLNYFGLAFLLIGAFFYAQKLVPWSGRNRLPSALIATILLALAFQPPLSGGLFKSYPLSGEHNYQNIRPLLLVLHKECNDQPGVVLADRNIGHYIRFHTKCSVIANNFLLTKQHLNKVMTADYLFLQHADQISQQELEIRYILAILNDAYEQRDGFTVIKDLNGVVNRNPQLIRDLFTGSVSSDIIKPLKEIEVETRGGKKVVFAGVYKVVSGAGDGN